MSTSLLYHGFGLKGYRYVNTRYQHGSILFSVRQNHENLRCAACGSDRVICRGKVKRRFRSLPIGLKPVWILLAIQAALYGLGLVAGALDVGRKSGWRYAPLAPLVFAILHFAYGLGSLWGGIRFCALAGRGLRKPEDMQMSR